MLIPPTYGILICFLTFVSTSMNLQAPYLPGGYCMEPSEIIGAMSVLLGYDTLACQFQAPTSYIPFGHFLADPANLGIRDVWVVNTSNQGIHWVLAFADIQQQSKRVWVVDPLHHESKYRTSMVELIKELVPEIITDAIYLDLQV